MILVMNPGHDFLFMNIERPRRQLFENLANCDRLVSYQNLSGHPIPACRLFIFSRDSMQPAKSLHHRATHFIAQLSEAELRQIWPQIEALALDLQGLRAINAAQQALTPGDALTREEALVFLSAD
jgi:hypothetical protein